MDNKIYIKTLLTKFLQNQCSQKEQLEVFDFLQTPEGQSFLEENMDAEWEALFKAEPGLDPRISQRILERLTASVAEAESSRRRFSTFIRSGSFRIAASVIGFLVAFAAGYQLYNQFKTYHYTTDKGQQRTIILPDGSLVSLNSNSTLTYQKGWNTRTVSLVGEGYFDVSHDADNPFFVKTSGVEIKVLGTAFNVKAYQADRTIETALLRGRVLIKNVSEGHQGDELVLVPNEVALFDQRKLTMNKVPKEKSDYKPWYQGNLVFEDAPLSVIIPELEKWFDTRISIDPESMNCRFSLNIDQESLSEVMKLFEVASEAKLELGQKEVKLKGSICR